MSPLYPTVFPTDSIKAVIGLVEAGTASANKISLAYNLWIIEGYALAAFLGDPNAAQIQSLPTHSPVDVLKQALAVHEGDLSPQSLPAPVSQLLQWVVQQLITLIQTELGLSVN